VQRTGRGAVEVMRQLPPGERCGWCLLGARLRIQELVLQLQRALVANPLQIARTSKSVSIIRGANASHGQGAREGLGSRLLE